MNIKRAELAGTYFNARQLPADPRPKVLFLGRSNVGMSSLINALLGRRLARTSATPGKTLSVNYYRVDAPPTPANVASITGLTDAPSASVASRA